MREGRLLSERRGIGAVCPLLLSLDRRQFPQGAPLNRVAIEDATGSIIARVLSAIETLTSHFSQLRVPLGWA